MKITHVETFLLRLKLKRPFGASVSVPYPKHRETLLVKISTDQRLVGWGETAEISGTRGTIDNHLAPALVGQDPMRHGLLWRNSWGPNFGNGMAVGAIDMALADIRGKALGVPVGDLYGGRLRDRVPAYASTMSYTQGLRPENQYPDDARRMVKKGFRALKMRLGRYPVEREAVIAGLVRESVGPEIKLMADGNGHCTLHSALALATELRKLDFEFLEEPMPQAPDYAGYEELTAKSPLTIAAGEVVDSRTAAARLIERRAMNIIQPDPSLCGGIGEVLFIAGHARLSGIRCYPHCWGAAIVIAATLHAVSLIPDPHWGLPTDSPMLEFDQSENPLRRELVKKPFEIRDGFVDVPTEPGLGVEIDERVVRRYAV